MAMPVSLLIVVRSLISSLSTGPAAAGSGLTPALPGVNLPISEIAFYLLAIVCASLIHEAGHAIAAAHADVRVEGVGLAVFAIIPVAFVELATDSFSRADVTQRLGIVCAGVWHNIVLSLFCGLLLVAHPVLLLPVCAFGSGAAVTSLSPDGLTTGDLIESVNGCVVTGKQTWRDCVSRISHNNISGYCLTESFIRTERIHSLDPETCCPDEMDRHLCFAGRQDELFCLPARRVVDHSSVCVAWTDCRENSRCLTPQVSDDRTRLFRVSRRDSQSFIFWGTGQQLLSSVLVADCEVRHRLIPVSLILSYDSLLRYLISFSLALAVLNVVPCLFLDGQFILSAAVELLVRDQMNRIQQKRLCRAVSAAGSLLLVSCIAAAFLNLLFKKNTTIV